MLRVFGLVVAGWCLLSFSVSQAAPQLDDNEILEAIENELRVDDGVPAHQLYAEVKDGIVTLSGNSRTLLAKRRAVRLVKSLKGVRAVVNRIQVLPSRRNDSAILNDVKAAFRDDPVVESEELKVAVEKSRVTLKGTVDSFMERTIAEAAVASVRGVIGIDNQIQIEAPQQRSAEEIRPEILSRFRRHPFLVDDALEVAVEDGKVRLRGQVSSANEKDLARLLSWVAGVREVDGSEIEVQWWLDWENRRERFSVVLNDVELRRAVKDALLYDPRIDSATVEIRVRNAAVTLLGSVTSLAGKQAAERNARNTLGVRRVINYLKVKVPDWPGDLAVTKKAQEALARDAELAESKIRASSHFGRVHLIGRVDTHFEKMRAETVVANFSGALDVVNQLKVDSTWEPKLDLEIKEDTVRRLRWSPQLDRERVKVVVADGLVTLEGAVSTFQAKAAAARHAYQAGAQRVINLLEVKAPGKNSKPGKKVT